MNANERLYRKRALKNAVAMCLSCGATAFGLLWLAWILLTTIINGFQALNLRLFTQMTPPPGSEEGGLSVPDHRALVPRAEWVKVRARDRNGQPFELEADDLLAICIQHEMDHLVGKLFVDYLSPLKRQRIRQKLEKMAREDRKVL